MNKFIIKTLAVLTPIMVIVLFFPKGRGLNFLLYLSLLCLSLSLAFLIPVFIANAIATVYEHLDPNPERRGWIGASMRIIGTIIGGRNVWSQLRPDEHFYNHRSRRYF